MNNYQEYIDDLARHCTVIDCQEQQRMLALKWAREEDIVAEYAALARQLNRLLDDDASCWTAQTLELAGNIVRDWSSQMKRLGELNDLLQQLKCGPFIAELVDARSAFIRKEMRWNDVPDALTQLKDMVRVEIPPATPEKPAPVHAAQSPAPEAAPTLSQDAPNPTQALLAEALAKIAAMTAAPPVSEPKPAAIIRYAGEVFSDFEGAPELVVLPSGEFWMGSPESEKEHIGDESPRHQVRIDYELAIGKFPVTFDDWDACFAAGGTQYRPADQGWGRGKRPVINVSWNDAQDYLRWLSEKTGQRYRLLSEAEWEYAARAEQGERRYPWGDDLDSSQLGAHAWYNGNSGGRPQVVGQKRPNAFGLEDLHGNIHEWVEDIYLGSYDATPDNGNPQTDGGLSRVLRGGSWQDTPRYLRSASRYRFPPDHRCYIAGFRVARVIQPEKARGS